MDVAATLESVQPVKFMVQVEAADKAADPSKVVAVLAAPTVRLPEPEQLPLMMKLLAAPLAVNARKPVWRGKLSVDVTGAVVAGEPPAPPPHATNKARQAGRSSAVRQWRRLVTAWNMVNSRLIQMSPLCAFQGAWDEPVALFLIACVLAERSAHEVI